MKLAAGPLKFLLLDLVAIERNINRTEGRTQPVSRVIVQNEDGTTSNFFATNVAVLGEVRLSYSQHAPLLKLHNENIRAAYVTNAEVVLDAEPEVEPVVAKPAKSAKPTKPAKASTTPVVITKETITDGE